MFVTIIIFIFTLLVLVISHEFGHFLVARKFGVKVLEFGFGLPPRVWGKKIGETLVSLNLLPVGGFVRLMGEDETEKEKLNKEGSFAIKPVGQRMLIVMAGVIMNLLLGWLLLYVVLFAQNFSIIYPTLDQKGISVVEVQKDLPAANSDLKSGEKVVAIDNKEVNSVEDLTSEIKSKQGASVSLQVTDINGENERILNLTPKEVSPGNFKLGVAFSLIPIKQYTTLTEKVFSAPLYSLHLFQVTFQGLGRVISDVVTGNFNQAANSVAGPVGLAVVTGNIVSAGWAAFLTYLWFVAIISLSLAIFNILPIPAVDGGRLLFLLIEGAFGKGVKPEVEKAVHTVGMILLIFLIILITVSDIKKFF